MEYWGQQYLQKRIETNQDFLLKLLNFNIAGYNPLRKWLGIDYKGKIDEISHLSFAYNTEYFKKGNQWYKKQTRVYQQPDLGYKLNLILERIPEVIIPKVGQPSWGLLQMRLLSNTTATYQPATTEANISQQAPTTAWPDETTRHTIGYQANISDRFNSCFDFNLSDIADGATFTDATLSIYVYGGYNSSTSRSLDLLRLTTTAFTDSATWNTYNGTNNWTTAGGDYTTTNKVTKSGTASYPAWWSWTSAQTLIQDCWNNQSKHVKVLARDPTPTDAYLAAYSYHYTTDTTLRPKLTVTHTATVTTYTTTALATTLQPSNAISNQSTTALTTNLEPNKWSKETTNTTIWTKEPTHDDLYYD